MIYKWRQMSSLQHRYYFKYFQPTQGKIKYVGFTFKRVKQEMTTKTMCKYFNYPFPLDQIQVNLF